MRTIVEVDKRGSDLKSDLRCPIICSQTTAALFTCLMTCHSLMAIPHWPTQGLAAWFGVMCFWDFFTLLSPCPSVHSKVTPNNGFWCLIVLISIYLSIYLSIFLLSFIYLCVLLATLYVHICTMSICMYLHFSLVINLHLHHKSIIRIYPYIIPNLTT